MKIQEFVYFLDILRIGCSDESSKTEVMDYSGVYPRVLCTIVTYQERMYVLRCFIPLFFLQLTFFVMIRSENKITITNLRPCISDFLRKGIFPITIPKTFSVVVEFVNKFSEEYGDFF